jgi:hypothetical protein
MLVHRGGCGFHVVHVISCLKEVTEYIGTAVVADIGTLL